MVLPQNVKHLIDTSYLTKKTISSLYLVGWQNLRWNINFLNINLK